MRHAAGPGQWPPIDVFTGIPGCKNTLPAWSSLAAQFALAFTGDSAAGKDHRQHAHESLCTGYVCVGNANN